MMRATTVAAAAFALLLLASSASAGRQLRDAETPAISVKCTVDENDCTDASCCINLGTAANYVILSKTGVSTVPGGHTTGDIAVSPAALTYATGFSHTLVSNTGRTHAISAQVTGKIYAADMTTPISGELTIAVDASLAAYNAAAARTTSTPLGDFSNVADGLFNTAKTFTAGVYTWTTPVAFNAQITISGTATDIFIFQITNTLTVADETNVILQGGVLAENIFWQVAQDVEVGKTSEFKGIILGFERVTFKTGAKLNDGRILSQTFVALDQATITQPTP
jgi:hypothetical protein